MVIHEEGREGGVLPVIASRRGRRGGGPEVMGARGGDSQGTKNEEEGQIGKRSSRVKICEMCGELTHKLSRYGGLQRDFEDQRGLVISHNSFSLHTRAEDSLL